MSQTKKQRRERLRDMLAAKAEIDEARARLDSAYAYFNSISDPELIEPCVYELSALHARYNSAIRKAKHLDLR